MEEPFSVTINNTKAVLILIIMEDTHGVSFLLKINKPNIVLILIVMEDTHGDFCSYFLTV